MPVVRVGNIKITTTFKTSTRYTKDGRMVTERYMYTSYRNTATGRYATAADLKAAGIKNRQAPSVKLTGENASFLFNRAMRAEAGEIKAKNFANLIGSRSFGVPTSKQQQQFKDALKDMFRSSNPSDEELAEWEAMIDDMTPEECQEFYERYQRDLAPGFKGYHSRWTTIDTDPMANATADDVMRNYRAMDRGMVARQKGNRDVMRPKMLNAARTFLKDKGKLQRTLDEF